MKQIEKAIRELKEHCQSTRADDPDLDARRASSGGLTVIVRDAAAYLYIDPVIAVAINTENRATSEAA